MENKIKMKSFYVSYLYRKGKRSDSFVDAVDTNIDTSTPAGIKALENYIAISGGYDTVLITQLVEEEQHGA